MAEGGGGRASQGGARANLCRRGCLPSRRCTRTARAPRRVRSHSRGRSHTGHTGGPASRAGTCRGREGHLRVGRGEEGPQAAFFGTRAPLPRGLHSARPGGVPKRSHRGSLRAQGVLPVPRWSVRVSSWRGVGGVLPCWPLPGKQAEAVALSPPPLPSPPHPLPSPPPPVSCSGGGGGGC